MKKRAPKSKKIQMALSKDKRFKPISRDEALNYLTTEIRKRERCERLLHEAARELYVMQHKLAGHEMYLIALAGTAMELLETDRLFFEHETMKEMTMLSAIKLEFADESQQSVYLTLVERENAETNDTAQSGDQKEQWTDTQESQNR